MKICSRICRVCCELNGNARTDCWTAAVGRDAKGGRAVGKATVVRFSAKFFEPYDRMCLQRIHDRRTDGELPVVTGSRIIRKTNMYGKEAERLMADAIFAYVDSHDDFELSKECPFYLEQIAFDAIGGFPDEEIFRDDRSVHRKSIHNNKQQRGKDEQQRGKAASAD